MKNTKTRTLTEKDLEEMLQIIYDVCKGKHTPCNLMSGVCERCGVVGVKFDRPQKRKGKPNL